MEILHSFGDSEASVFSIHNLLEAGKAYGLVPGSWIGPYAMCCSWRSLSISKGKEPTNGSPFLPMAVYVVSGDANGERGGAPVVCIDDASRHCSEFSKGEADWTPLLLLVPLVIGLDKVNPRSVWYFFCSSLAEKFFCSNANQFFSRRERNSSFLEATSIYDLGSSCC